MPRFSLTIEYDGTPFVGWQVQAAGASVQGVLAEAVFALSGERVRLTGAGRTDAGVHALGQVAHLDLARDWRPDTLRDGLNAHLRPHPVAVLEAARAADDFDARLSARQRHYRYRIVNRRAPLTVARGRAWHVDSPARCRGDARGRAGSWSASTTSPPSAPPSVRPRARSRRWIASRWRATARR